MSMTETVGNAFTKKLGPFPGFVWVLIILGGAYGYYWFANRGGSGEEELEYEAPNSIWTPGPIEPVTEADYGNDVDNGTPGLSTNAMWALHAGNLLIATGSYSAIDVSNALANYLNGKALDAQQQALINIAVAKYGLPPEGVIPVSVTPTPTPTPTPKPTPKPAAKPKPKSKVRYYTVRRGDNLSVIAARYYGWQDWRRIYNANRSKIRNPNLIYAGQVLVIP